MADDSLLGRQLANFKIERSIGRGGMAQVYYGQDVKLERPVAVKVIDVRHRGNPAYAERFVREAKTVATWRHENIIQIHYADDEDGLYYFVMEYIDGFDLGELIAQYTEKGQKVPHDKVITLGQDIAAALDYAHQQGVIHRDVKPANVMVGHDDRVVLTDFGLALDVEQGSMGEAFGSSHYIAPEQARRSADAVPQSDIYALGVLLYEMLTGHVPFNDPSPTTVALQHITLLPPPPRDINPELSEDVEAVLLKALQKSPSERYQSGQALMDALSQALRDESSLPTDIKPASTTEPDRVTAKGLIASDDLTGQQLDEYRLETLLGQGGMARVYRASDVRLKRWVAIKVIDTPFQSDSDYTMRFEREAQAIAQLEHPHIVRLYRYGESQGLFYMAMQFVEGADLEYVLSTYHEEGEFIESEEAERIVSEICGALDYAHSQGVIHRDIKPANVVLNKSGQAILTDFGLALMTDLGTSGEIFGSPHYIAPEQAISSAGVVPQSDLYAVGVMIYEMFTGELPFEAEGPLDVAMLHIHEHPPSPREIRPELSPALEAVILKALAKEPEDRYPTGAALTEALQQALQAAPIQPPAAMVDPAQAGASILDRVALDLAAHPLPPIPAAATPPLAVDHAKSTPQVASRPTTPPPPTPVTIPDPVTVSDSDQSKATSNKKPALFIAGGLGAILITGFVLILLLLAAYLLWPSSEATSGVVTTPTAATSENTGTDGNEPPPSTPSETGEGDTASIEPTLAPAAEAPEPTAAVLGNEIYYSLRIEKGGANGQGSLVLINQGVEDLPLAMLVMGEAKTPLRGINWGLGSLPPGACVVVDNKEGKGGRPPLTCNQLGTSVEYGGGSRKNFWTNGFDLYFGGQTAATCPNGTTPCDVAFGLERGYLQLTKPTDQSLIVYNLSYQPLPLSSLGLGNLNGAEWGLEMLPVGACVDVWKDDKKKRTDSEESFCPDSNRLIYPHFWKEDFAILYNGQQVDTCAKGQDFCSVTIP